MRHLRFKRLTVRTPAIAGCILGVSMSSVLFWANPARAVLAVTPTVDSTTQIAPGGYTASSTDLINNGRISLASVAASSAGAFQQGGYTILNDGTAGTSANNTGITSAPNSSSQFVTYTLNTSGTGSTTGYDINEVDTIAGWADARIYQNIELDVTTTSNPTFTPLLISNGNSNGGDSYLYQPATGATSSSRLRFADSVSPGTVSIATDVTAIRFYFRDNLNGPPNSNGGAYREFDVYGVASAVPEPTSMGLLGIGGLLTLRRRRGSRSAPAPVV